MSIQIKFYAFERISSVMSREFGSIKKGDEEDYSFFLMPMETNLLKANRIHRINNGRRAIEAIRVCLFIIDGYMNQKEYDLDEYITKENEAYINALLMSFDPFTNEEIKTKLEEENFDFNNTADLRNLFSVPVMCLVRIEKSIELWTKENGVSGYFDFIEGQIGGAIKHDDVEMNFNICLPAEEDE